MKSTVVILIILSLFICPDLLFPDTVILKNNTRIVGNIINESNENIIISTLAGRKSIQKLEIRSMLYERDKQKLINVAKNHMREGRYAEAYASYESLYEFYPGLQEARERMHYLKRYIHNNNRMKVKDIVYNGEVKKERVVVHDSISLDELVNKVEENMGIVLSENNGEIVVDRITSKRRGLKGLCLGDKIIALWGESTENLDLHKILEILLLKGEDAIEIERLVKPYLKYKKNFFNKIMPGEYKKVIGAVLKPWNGKIIVSKVFEGGSFAKVGIKEGDTIYKINSQEMLNIPFKNMVGCIKENYNMEIEIVIRRTIVIWR